MIKHTESLFDNGSSARLFTTIAKNIRDTGYSIQTNALPEDLVQQLYSEIQNKADADFDQASIGRSQNQTLNSAIRSDSICWIDDSTNAGKNWLSWTQTLQTRLNQQLLLGLFSFESHFARYQVGACYKKHQDAFQGQSNRIVSIVAYFNTDWIASDGGELVIYTDKGENKSISILPSYGTIVVFLSEEFPHEVLPANRDRYSIAGWYRLNSSNQGRIDPPT